MKTNDDLNDLGPEQVGTVTMLRSELAQLEALLEAVRKRGQRSPWWAQFRPIVETMLVRMKQVPEKREEELRPSHWLNFFTAPSGRMEKP